METNFMDGEVVKCGYLTKSPSSGGRGRFKRRWFVLTDSRQLDSSPASGNGASASSSSSFKLDYYEKENRVRKGSIDLGARCLMLEDPDRVVPGGKKRRQSSPCFNLILTKETSKRKSLREAYASRFQLQACSEEEKQSWLEAFEQCGVNVLRPERQVGDRDQGRPKSLFLADDVPHELEESTSSHSSAIPVPNSAHLPTQLAATVPGGQTFASCTGEDVPLSVLYGCGGDGGGLTSSYGHSHAIGRYSTPDFHTQSHEELGGYGTSDRLGFSPCCRDSKDSFDLFNDSSEDLVSFLPTERWNNKTLSCNLHELNGQLESTHYIKMYNQDQIFLSCHTLSAGHFGAVHKATLLPLSSEPVLQTVSVRVVGSHCPEREAVRVLREACIMLQLCHRNVATVLGMVLSQCPNMIVLEYLSEGDLQNYLQSLQALERRERESLPTKLLSYCQQIACGMSFLVERGCVVSSLATRYILLSDKDVCKITGVECPSFRLSCDPVPLAPMCQIEDCIRFEKDIWSFGTVLYEVWSLGCTPSEPNKKVKSLSRVSAVPPPGCSKSIYRLMMKCWNSFSSDKPTWVDINSALKDPETVLLSIPEAHEGEDCHNDLIPLEAFLVGSPIETAINLYMDVQKEYETELVSRQQQQQEQQPAESAQSAFQDDVESVHLHQTVSSQAGKDGRAESSLQEVKANLERMSTPVDFNQ